MTANHPLAKGVPTVLVATLLILLVIALATALEAERARADHQASVSDAVIVGTTDQIVSLDPADAYDFHSWDIVN